MKSCALGNSTIVLRLINDSKIPINKSTATGETLLMRAVWNQKEIVVRLLIENYADLDLEDANG